MTDSPDPAAVWREFCSRIAEAGAAVLDDPAASGSRNQAEGLRCLSRQLVFAVQDAVEFRDADFPALHRFDDDVTKWGGPNTDNNHRRRARLLHRAPRPGRSPKGPSSRCPSCAVTCPQTIPRSRPTSAGA